MNQATQYFNIDDYDGILAAEQRDIWCLRRQQEESYRKHHRSAAYNTPPLIKQAQKIKLIPRPPMPITIRVRELPSVDNTPAVVSAAAFVCGVPEAEIYQRGRQIKKVICRQMIWLYLKESKARISLNKMGDLFGMDHSTVIHGIETMAGRIEKEPELKEKYEAIRKELLEIENKIR